MSLLLLFWTVKEIKVALFSLYLTQLKEYHLGRFLVYFKTHQGKSLFWNKIIFFKIIILFFIIINPLAIWLLGALYLVEFLHISWKFIQDKIKKPIFTKKIILLFSLLLLIIFVSLIVVLKFLESFVVYLLLFDIFSYPLFFLVIFILQPLTVFQRKRIIKKAKNKRNKHNLTVIGITGSYGKTTTKEFLATILQEKFKVLKTKDHKNSEMGISQTILQELKKEHQIFICEMAAYNKGGIDLLAKMTKPDLGIITGINEQHLALFGSRENLIQAEGGKELINKLKDTVFFNGDDKNVLGVYQETKKNKILCSLKNKADFFVPNYKMKNNLISFTLQNKQDLIDFKLKTLGKHNVSNLLLAIAVARKLDMNWQEIKRGVEKITPDMTGIKTFFSNHGFLIIDSSYSANPTGVIADLNYLADYQGKKVIVMPCLIELGEAAQKVHEKIGKKIDKVCDLAIITTPDHFADLKSKKAILLQDKQKIISKLKSFCSQEDTVLIEGRIKKDIIKKI